MSATLVMTSTLRAAQARAGANAAAPAARSADVARLVAAGEEALLAGNAAAATSLFERAAEREHSSDIEQGIVRAHMQGGQYRRALAFSAHVARSHPQAEGSMLFAQLLDLGGQPQLARRVLSRAETLEPGSTVSPKTHGPAASGVIASPQARTVATGTVIDAGMHVVVPASALSNEQRLWVRDGLGRTANATRLRDAAELGLALLRIDEPWLDTPAPLAADRPAFAGSVVHVMAHASAAPHAAWPFLRSGFLRTEGRTDGALGVPRVDAQRVQGGAVFDAQGRWMGVWVEPEGGGGGVLVSAQALMSRFGQTVTISSEPRRPLDEIYERAMRWTVQVLAGTEPRHP